MSALDQADTARKMDKVVRKTLICEFWEHTVKT